MARYIETLERMKMPEPEMEEFYSEDEMAERAYANGWNFALYKAIELLPRGEWKDVFHGFGTCSECDRRNVIDNYCPNCGAEMQNDNR